MAHNSGQRPQLLGSRHIGTDQGDIQTHSPHSILSGDGDASGEHLSNPPKYGIVSSHPTGILRITP